MRALILATVVTLGLAESVGAATVSGLYTQPTALTPTHLIIDVADDWKSITFSINSAQPFGNIFSSFRPSTFPQPTFFASGAGLSLGPDGVELVASAPKFTYATNFSWTISASESIFPYLGNGYFLNACWFGNELCNNAKISFWSGDRARDHFEFDVWSSPGQVPVPATAPMLGAAVTALAWLRGRRRA